MTSLPVCGKQSPSHEDHKADFSAAGPITDQEILAVIGPEGTTAGILANKFKARLVDPAVKAAFVASLRRLVENRPGPGGAKTLYLRNSKAA